MCSLLPCDGLLAHAPHARRTRSSRVGGVDAQEALIADVVSVLRGERPGVFVRRTWVATLPELLRVAEAAESPQLSELRVRVATQRDGLPAGL